MGLPAEGIILPKESFTVLCHVRTICSSLTRSRSVLVAYLSADVRLHLRIRVDVRESVDSPPHGC